VPVRPSPRFPPLVGTTQYGRVAESPREPGEQPESFGGGGAGFGGVDHEYETRVGGDGEFFKGKSELAGDGVVEALGAGAVSADVVCAPQGAEGVTASAQLPDEVLQGTVVGSRPASARMIETHISANRSQSV
jgi:hypothetical protein